MVKTEKKELTPIEKEVAAYLRRKAQFDGMEKELKQMKATILTQLDTLSFVDGVCELSTGTLKEVANPPKMVKVNGDPMEASDRAKLAELLDPKYLVKDVNFKLLMENLDSDSKLRKVLKLNKTEIRQEIRIDIKRKK